MPPFWIGELKTLTQIFKNSQLVKFVLNTNLGFHGSWLKESWLFYQNN